jgi:hypothetical protein
LQDCDATIKFIHKVNDLIDAMNANTPRWSIPRKEAETEKSLNDEIVLCKELTT